MTSLYLNSSPSSFPIPDLNQDQNLHHHHLNLFSSSFFNTTTAPQFQSELLPKFGDSHHHHQVVDHYISHSGLSDPKAPPPSSFEASVNRSGELHERDEVEDHYSEGINASRRTEGSAKWIPSKMRIMQKMIDSNICASENDHDKPLKYTLRFQDHHTNYNESSSSSSQSIIRGCSDCNTTTTPLWRSGPKGPKTLCNACGIRQRKARRAMAAAEAAVGNGTVRAAAETKPGSKVQVKKEKKLRTGHVIQCKKSGRSPDLDQLPHKPNISFKNFGFNFHNNNSNDSALHHHHSVFPRDVEQAAILLMELSCGFVHV